VFLSSLSHSTLLSVRLFLEGEGPQHRSVCLVISVFYLFITRKKIQNDHKTIRRQDHHRTNENEKRKRNNAKENRNKRQSKCKAISRQDKTRREETRQGRRDMARQNQPKTKGKGKNNQFFLKPWRERSGFPPFGIFVYSLTMPVFIDGIKVLSRSYFLLLTTYYMCCHIYIY
jgi:hypothetical protein